MAPLVPMEDERELRESLTRRMCCIGDHERVQKKTFTRWLNKHERISIEDLYDDLKDGKVLIALLEHLSGDVIVHDQSPHSQNVQSMEAVLSFLKQQQARIVNIRSFDITVGNPKLTLSLIWTVILHYQVSVPGEQVELLTWAQQVVGHQPGLPCHDLSSCWQDGRLFNTILHRFRPGLVDLEAVHHQSNKQNLQQAFSTAEHHLGIPQLLDPEDVDVNSPDERSIATYLAVLRQAAEGHLPQDGKKLGEGPEDVQSLKKQPPLPSVQDSQRYTHGGVTKEDQACLTFITELQAWVDMNQKEVNATNFGEDLKEVATLVEEQNASHDAIEELRKSLEEAQQCKESLSASCRADYDKRFDVLQRSYNVLVSSSNKRRRQLQELLTFLRAATDKLTWLGSCEDRQVSLDWSDNCPQLNDRQEDYVLLMQEMARQDPAFHGILEQGEELLQEGHPACRLLEGYIDALQTQWSWLLQLDSCTETHLQKNAEYFQFFRDSQSLHQELTSLHDSLVQECSCDCDSDVARLSKALDSIQKKSECLSELHAGVAKLSKKADKVVQLKPRRADYVLESSIPICAICDYKQSNVTLVKNSMYKLEGLHENGKWSIQDSDGRHALVPSVCFIVPPPNVEAGERARRLEEQQLEVKHLFKQRKLDIEAILSWHHLQDTIKSINSWTPCSFQDLSEEVCNGVLDRLENQSSDFKEKIKGSRVFPPEKLWQLEKDASSCKHHYQALLNNLVSEENEEQTYRQLLTELQATGDRLMSLRDEVVQVVKEQSADSSLDNMPSMLTRQERLDQEVDNLGTRLDQIGQQCEPLLNHASRAPSQADLRAELDRCLQIRPHLSDLSTSSLDRLRSLKQVRSIMTGLELHLVKFETSLAEQSSVPTNAQAIEQYQQSVKGMRADLSRHSGTLQRLQDEVSRAHSATEGLSRLEPCAGNLEPVAEAARLLHQRWRDVGSQMDSRLCELDHLSLLLAEYRESYDCVIQWLLGVSAQQDLSQIRQGKSSRELQSHLIQQKALIAKVERTQEEVTRCHELSEKYCNAVKEYEAKLAAYRDLVESITGAVPDHRPTSSALNNIEKEVISLLDRYTSLLNLTKDNAKLLGEALQQAQENEEDKQRQRETQPSQEALLKGTHSNGPETGNAEMNSKAKLENVIKMENFESQNHVYQLPKECVAMLRWEAEVGELHQRSQEAAIVQLELDESKREAKVLHDQVLMTCVRYEKAETELETIQAKTREHMEYNTDMERKRAKFQEVIKEALNSQRESDLRVHRCHIELEDVQTHISEGKNQGLDRKRAEASAYAKTQKAMQALGEDRKWVAKLEAQELKMFREAEAMIQARECGVANVNALLAQLCQLSHEHSSAEHRFTQLHVRTSALAQDLKEAEARVATCAQRLAELQLCVLDGRRGVDPANIDREERLRLWGEVLVNRKEAEEKEVQLQTLLDTTSRRDIPVSEVEQHHRSRLTHPDASEKQSDIIVRFAETAVTHVQWITEMEERMTSMRVASLDQVHLLAGSPSEQTNQLLIESLQKKSMESPNGSLQDLLCLYDEVETKMKSIHQELTQRQGMTEQLCCLASDLSALVNSSWAETRASEVKSRLVAATDLACSHLVRIHEDWQKAKTFQNAAQDHLVWCLDAEQALKALDISGDEGSFQNVSKQLTDWMQKLESQHFILAESESMAEDILHVCPPGGAAIILRWARIIRGRFDEVQACANGIQTRIAANRFALEKDTRRAEELMSWLASMQDMMAEEEIESEKAEVTKECLARHQALVTEMTALQPEVDRLVRLYRRRGLSDPLSPISSSSTLSPSTPSTQPDFRSGTSPGNQVSNQSSPPVPMGCSSPQLQPLLTLWQRVWLAVLDRQGRLRETQNNPQEKKEDKKDNEDFFTTWGWRCLQWAGHRRLRVLDYFCRLDKDQDGLIHRQDFIQALLDSKTGINDEEATTIARMFEKGGGLVDYYELVEALTSAPTRGQPQTDADKIDDEVTRKVAACRCPKRFQVEQIEENKYRFGESQQLRLVRILRSAVMVRVGGGWSSLDEFLLKNDPCRASVDGCSTMDMRNRLAVPDGKGLTAAAFQPKPRRSPLGRSPSAPSLPQQISGASAIINPKGKVSRASSQRSVKSRTPVAKTSQSSASSPSNRSGCSSKKLSRSRSLGKPEDLMAWETVASPVYSQTDIAHQSESRQVHTGAHQPNGKSSRIPTAMPTSALSRKTSNRWR